MFKITNQKDLRAAFWAARPHFDEQARAAGIRSKGQNAQCTTVRCDFVDYVDMLHRDGVISEALASRATL